MTLLLLITLVLGQTFAVQAHQCDAMMMQAESSLKMSDLHQAPHHQMHNDAEMTQESQKTMDCCNECICLGSTCSSLVFALSTGLNTEFVSQQKKPQYRFSVIAAHINPSQKPPITA